MWAGSLSKGPSSSGKGLLRDWCKGNESGDLDICLMGRLGPSPLQGMLSKGKCTFPAYLHTGLLHLHGPGPSSTKKVQETGRCALRVDSSLCSMCNQNMVFPEREERGGERRKVRLKFCYIRSDIALEEMIVEIILYQVVLRKPMANTGSLALELCCVIHVEKCIAQMPRWYLREITVW